MAVVSCIFELPLEPDGKTAYERLKRKSAKVLGVEFGETVMWKRRPIGPPLGKLSAHGSVGVGRSDRQYRGA